jgi:HK97 family phage portal protein
MADAAFRRLKDQLTQRVRKNRRNGEPLLLEAGLKAKSVAVNSKDSLTVETYNAMVLRICGLMRVSPHKIMHLDQVKYDNQAHANDAYANTSLIPIAEEIEEGFRLSLIDDEDWGRLYPEFDRMTLMATDAASLTKILDTFVKNGVMELNEARDKLPLGLNPLPNGDVRYVPVNTAIIDRDGNVIQQAAEGQNQGAGEGEDADDGNEDEQQRTLRLVSTKD